MAASNESSLHNRAADAHEPTHGQGRCLVTWTRAHVVNNIASFCRALRCAVACSGNPPPGLAQSIRAADVQTVPQPYHQKQYLLEINRLEVPVSVLQSR